jgi:hypothetical protein
MVTTQTYWGDGTTDVITLTYSGEIGMSKLTLSSNPNISLSERTKTIFLKTPGGTTINSLTVKQEGRTRAYSRAYSRAYE